MATGPRPSRAADARSGGGRWEGEAMTSPSRFHGNHVPTSRVCVLSTSRRLPGNVRRQARPRQQRRDWPGVPRGGARACRHRPIPGPGRACAASAPLGLGLGPGSGPGRGCVSGGPGPERPCGDKKDCRRLSPAGNQAPRRLSLNSPLSPPSR